MTKELDGLHQPEARELLDVLSHGWINEAKDIQVVSQSKGQSLARDPGIDSEQLVG